MGCWLELRRACRVAEAPRNAVRLWNIPSSQKPTINKAASHSKKGHKEIKKPSGGAGGLGGLGMGGDYWLLQQPPLEAAGWKTGRAEAAFLAASPATWVVWPPEGICMVLNWRSKGIEYFFSIFSR